MIPGCAIRGRLSCSTRRARAPQRCSRSMRGAPSAGPSTRMQPSAAASPRSHRARQFRSDLVVEGGGFLSDGEGTLITAESCVLNPNRNPGWTKSEADAELRAMLGVQKIIWLPGDLTDAAHRRTCRRICGIRRPGRGSLRNRRGSGRSEILASWRRTAGSWKSETDARGRRFELLPIAEAPRTAVPDGEETLLPFVCEFLSGERRRHRARLRDRGRCRGRRNSAARVSAPAGRVSRAARLVSRRRRNSLHHPARAARPRYLNTRKIVDSRPARGL